MLIIKEIRGALLPHCKTKGVALSMDHDNLFVGTLRYRRKIGAGLVIAIEINDVGSPISTINGALIGRLV